VPDIDLHGVAIALDMAEVAEAEDIPQQKQSIL